MTDDLPLSDQVSIELDRRKLEKLINSGKITREELANAPIVEVESPMYEFDKPDGMSKRVVGVTCGRCSAEFKTMEEFHDHLINHFKPGGDLYEEQT